MRRAAAIAGAVAALAASGTALAAWTAPGAGALAVQAANDFDAPVLAAAVVQTDPAASPGALRAGVTYRVYVFAVDADSGVAGVSADVSAVGPGGTVALSPCACTVNGVSYGYQSAVLTVAAGLAEGPATVAVTAVDTLGNAARFTATATVDNTAPSPSLTAPPGQTTNPRPSFGGVAGTAAGDASTVSLKVYAGSAATGTPVATVAATRNGSSWSAAPAANLADGTYTVQAEQADSAGNLGRSPARTFLVDTVAPAVAVSAPAAGASLATTTPSVSGAAGTASGDGTSVTVTVWSGDAASGTPVRTLNATAAAGAWSAAVSPALADGTYTARASQPDAAGNTGQSTAVTFTIDTTAPTVTVTAPAAGSAVATRTPALSGTAGAATGDGTAVTVKVWSGASATGTPAQTLTATPSGTAWSIAPASLADGQWTIQASQSDAAGNTGQSAAGTFTVDATAPAVTLAAPAAGASLKTTLPTFSGTAGTGATDSTTITVKIYSGTVATGTPARTLTVTRSGASWSVGAGTALAAGTYTARAEQADTAGNVGLSAAGTFTIDTTAPAITAITSNDNDGVIETGDTLTVTFSEPLAALTTTTTTITESRPNGNANVTLSVFGLTNGAVDTGGTGYVGSRNASLAFAGTLSLSGSTVTLTVGACTSGCAEPAAGTGPLALAPASGLTDLAGNAATATFTTAATFRLF